MRGEPRLDPVRWRRPGRAALLKPALVAALLATAAAVMWSGPQGCAQLPAAASPPAAATPALAARTGCHADPRPAPREPADTEDSDPPAPGDPAHHAVNQSDERQHDPWPDDDQHAAGAPTSRTRSTVPTGTVGVPIRLAEPSALRLLRPGDHVDLFRLTAAGQASPAVATAALVLDVTGADDPTTGGLLLALTPTEAQRTMTPTEHGYAVLIRPDG
ncbi:hypothetical protein ACIBSW_04590 [Actinoplanes sp. NPDC049668]|uniref:hypothetical protein n=1 Tax=unclassified Actinoplanes TaxID=2626549 RepID=UPI0033A28931